MMQSRMWTPSLLPIWGNMVNLTYLGNGSVLLIDGSNLLIRIFYSKKKDNVLLTSLELREACANIFLHQLGIYCKKYNCNRLYVAFDLGGSLRKRSIFSEYKANRTHTVVLSEGIDSTAQDLDKDFTEYIDLRDATVQLLRGFNIPVYMEAGIEADDMIGIAAEMLENMNQNVIILSNDTDFLQLVVNSSVTLVMPIKKTDITNSNFNEFFLGYKKVSILPREYVFYKAVIGDKTDNIDGIKGIAYKKLNTLLEDYLSKDSVGRDAYCKDFTEFLNYIESSAVNHKLIDILKLNLSTIRRNLKLISLSTEYMSGQAVKTTASILKEVPERPKEHSIIKTYVDLFRKAPSLILVSDILFSLRSVWGTK